MISSRENRKTFPAGVLFAISLFALWIDREIHAQGFPFDATVDLQGVGALRKVEPGEPFGFLLCLHALETEIDRIEITLVLPKEVERLGGETVWKGNLAPQQETCLSVGLRSRTKMEKWRRPLHAEMRFVYQGMEMTREVRWTDQSFDDTGFVLR